MSGLVGRFLHAAHPDLPSVRAAFSQAGQPPFNYGYRILKELSRRIRGAFSSANLGYMTFLGNDLKDGHGRFSPHPR